MIPLPHVEKVYKRNATIKEHIFLNIWQHWHQKQITKHIPLAKFSIDPSCQMMTRTTQVRSQKKNYLTICWRTNAGNLFSETPIGTLWTPKNLTLWSAYRFIPTFTMMMVIKYKFWNDNKDSRPGRQDLFYFLSHLQMLKDAKVWI